MPRLTDVLYAPRADSPLIAKLGRTRARTMIIPVYNNDGTTKMYMLLGKDGTIIAQETDYNVIEAKALLVYS